MYLFLCQRLIDLLDGDEFFNLHNLTGDILVDGIKDRCHSLLEAEGIEYVPCATRKTDCGSDEGDAEVGHCEVVVVVVAVGVLNVYVYRWYGKAGILCVIEPRVKSRTNKQLFLSHKYQAAHRLSRTSAPECVYETVAEVEADIRQLSDIRLLHRRG